MSRRLGVQFLIGLSGLKLAGGVGTWLGTLGLAGTETALPPWYHLAFLSVFFAGGMALLLGSHRDERPALLGTVFVLFSTVFADSLLARSGLMGDGLLRRLTTPLLMCQPVAFLPAVYWQLAERFPRTHDEQPATARSGLIRIVAEVAGAFLFAASLAELGPEAWGWLSRFGQAFGARGGASQFWPALAALLLPALVWMFVRTRRAPRDERRRLGLFAGGLIVGTLPLVGDVLLNRFVPAYAVHFSEPGPNLLLVILISAFLLIVPVTTAYAVIVDHVFDVRFFIRRAIQYALARYTVLAGLGLPLVAAGSLAWRNRARPLGEVLVDVPVGGWLLAFGAAATLLAIRGPLLTAVDRRFFREHYDTRRILLELVEGIRSAPTPSDLATLLVTELDRALHLDGARVLLSDRTTGSFCDPQGIVRPLSRATTLASLAGGSSTPLDVNLSREDSTLARLPADERVWLADANVRLIVPLIGSDRELLGVLLLGEKRSELPFSREDRMLVVTVAASAAISLESRAMSGSPDAGQRAALADWAADDQVPAHQCTACGWVAARGAAVCVRCDGTLDVALLPPVLAGKFALEQRAGSGGMGVVYRAVDLALHRLVALKTLPRVSPEHANQLRREARTMASVRHQHLAVIYGMEAWRGTPVLVLEYLEHGTLAERLTRARLDSGQVIELGVAMAAALRHVHGRGLLHRDVKPSNIGFTADDVPKLLDFGLVRLAGTLIGVATAGEPEPSASSVETASIRVRGTPAYLPPEAVQRQVPDESWDLWALGVTLYESLTGLNPFKGANVTETLTRVSNTTPEDPRQLASQCPGELARFLLACFSEDPRRRPRSAVEFEAGLRRASS